MATITIPSESGAMVGIHDCCHRLVIAKRARYATSGPSAKSYSFGRARTAGTCPNRGTIEVNGRWYCSAHAPPKRQHNKS